MAILGYILFFWFLLCVLTLIVIALRTDADMYFSDIEDFLLRVDKIGFIFRLITLYFVLPFALIKLLEK